MDIIELYLQTLSSDSLVLLYLIILEINYPKIKHQWKMILSLIDPLHAFILFQAAINEKCLELGKKKSKNTKLDLDDKPVKKSKSGTYVNLLNINIIQ